MDELFMHILLSIAGFSVAGMWAMNLWEIRNLRKDNRELSLAIANLTSTIAGLKVELENKVSEVDCAETRLAGSCKVSKH